MTALAGSGLGYSSLDSKSKESSSSALPAMAAVQVAGQEGVHHLRNCGPTQCAATLITPTAPTASSGSVMTSSPL